MYYKKVIIQRKIYYSQILYQPTSMVVVHISCITIECKLSCDNSIMPHSTMVCPRPSSSNEIRIITVKASKKERKLKINQFEPIKNM